MQKYFSLEGGIYRGLSLMGDLITLNLLLIVTSLPILTMGASLSAAYGICFKLIKGERVEIRQSYLTAFKETFQLSTRIFLTHLGVMGFLAVAIKLIGVEWIVFPLLVVLAMWLLLNEMLYPLLSLRHFSYKELYRQSFGITLKYLVPLVASFMLTLIGLLWPVFLIKLSFIWLALGGALIIYLKSKLLTHVLTKLKIEEN